MVHCCIVSGWIANPSNSFERDGEGRHAIDFGLLDSAGGGCYRLRGPTPYRKRTKALFAVAIGPLQHMRDVLYSVMAEGGDSDDDPMIGNGQGRQKKEPDSARIKKPSVLQQSFPLGRSDVLIFLFLPRRRRPGRECPYVRPCTAEKRNGWKQRKEEKSGLSACREFLGGKQAMSTLRGTREKRKTKKGGKEIEARSKKIGEK